MENYKLLEKAYEINFDKIKEGFLASPEICYAETLQKARSILLNKIKYEDWKLSDGSEISYINIPIKRCESADRYEFEGKGMTLSEIKETLSERKRMESLNAILTEESIKYCYIKKGAYYRPGASGYTELRHKAGIYTKQEAIKHATSCRDLTIIPINILEHNKMVNNEIMELQTRLLS